MRKAVFLFLLALALALAGCNGTEDAAPESTFPPETVETTPQGTDTVEPEMVVLQGEVGPGFEISLRTQDGREVDELPPGFYRIEVVDRASIHNFHLTGPAVDRATGVEAEEEVVWELELGPGEYTYLCDVHPNTMRGSFQIAADAEVGGETTTEETTGETTTGETGETTTEETTTDDYGSSGSNSGPGSDDSDDN